MRKWFNRMKLSEQILFYYLILFLGVFIVCAGAYVTTANRYLKANEDSTLEYGLQIAHSNMQTLFENVNNCSKSIAYSDTIQEAFGSGDTVGYENRLALKEVVIQNMSCFEGISSVYLFDLDGNSYTSGEISDVEIIRKQLASHSYFESSFEEDKDLTTKIITFSYDDKQGEAGQILSCVRRIRDLNTMKAVGTLVVNVAVAKTNEIIDAISGQTGIDLMLFDSDQNTIAATAGGAWLATQIERGLSSPGQENYREITSESKPYRVGAIEEENQSWSMVGGIPRKGILSDLQPSILIALVLFILGMAFGIIGASYITAKITRPLSNILISMEGVRDNNLSRVEVVHTNLEMDNLQQRYNHMLDEIDDLMSQKVEEQRLRKKYELSLLQEQIKPHFLYNTFDSVCALAKMGRTDDVYTMMQALGQYYRGSLHKGQTMITIKEEISIVENYLIIQSFRYDDVFEVEYDVDETVKEYKTIKLILQPLVENAIYHGLRENDLYGTIIIRAKDVGDYVKLQVEDDGIGMTGEALDDILNHSFEHVGKRFGLPGTIQRIQLYYNRENKNLVDIESEYQKGTRITVWIPKDEVEKNVESIDH